MATYLEHFELAYSQIRLEFGSADIFTDASGDGLKRTAAFVLLMKLATCAGKEDHARGVLVAAPPREVQLQCDQVSIEEAIVKATEVHFQRLMSPEEVSVVSQFVTVAHTTNLQVDSVLECLKTAGEEWAVVVMQAGFYRAERTTDTESYDGVSLPEDLWVPHLVELAQRSIPIAKEKQFYLLLDTGGLPLRNPATSRESRESRTAGSLDFTFITTPISWSRNVRRVGRNWQSQAHSNQRLQQSMNCQKWMDSHKAFLKLQLMDGIAPPDEILRVLRDDALGLLATTNLRAKLKIARIAERADDDGLSRRLLHSSVGGLRSAEDPPSRCRCRRQDTRIRSGGHHLCPSR